MRGRLAGLLVAGAVAVSAVVVVSADNGAGGSPTPTPTATPACTSATAYTPDSADLWGGCWPGPDTAGIPAGTTLTTYTGSCTITTPNTTIDSKTINCGELEIQALNVTITKSRINGYPFIDDSTPTTRDVSFSVADSELANPSATSNTESVGKSHFSITRSIISGGRRGAWCEYDCSITDNYIHGQEHGVLNCTTSGCAFHESGIRQGSGNGTTSGVQVIRHNTVACDAPDVAANEPGNESDTSGCSAVITGYGDFAAIQNNTVDRNLILATPGGYCAYGGNTGGGKPFPNGANNVWTDNVFVKGSGSHCGFFGTSTDFNTGLSGNSFTGNKFWNGTTLSNKSPNT